MVLRQAAEWLAIADRLKLTPCPHCQVVGTLNRHGFLYGFDDSSPRRKTVRARRIFCSNRSTRRGCGRTFSVWIADKIRRLSLTAGCLWRFLRQAVAGGIRAAMRAVDCHLSDRTLQRIWKRFLQGQSKIRTALWLSPYGEKMVRRARRLSAGANPARQLSFQPVAVGFI